MIDLFSPLRQLVKLNDISIDDFVFKLHYRVTFIFLSIGSILVTAYQLYGKPISCRITTGDAPQSVLDYCWITSTFSLPNYMNGNMGKNFVYPGVASIDDNDEVKYHSYYQWVCIMLIIQAKMFYIPHFIWKNWEGHKLKNLVLDLNNPILGKDTKEKQIKTVVTSLYYNLKKQNTYAYRFITCEVLNFVNVLLQIYFINRFLNGEFTTYGTDVWSFLIMDQKYRIDPMISVFPKVTKCTYYEFGTSGSVQTLDALCVLPLNNLNEKFYVFYWFWLIILIVVTGIKLVIEFLNLFVKHIRMRSLLTSENDEKSQRYNQKIKFILVNGSFGDWFVLKMLKTNINMWYFQEIIEDLCAKVYLMTRKKDKQQEADLDSTSKFDCQNSTMKLGEYEEKQFNCVTTSTSMDLKEIVTV